MKTILLTIDVEDWFQVENFKPWIPFSSWPSCELRVERNTHHLLDLFDSVSVRRLPARTESLAPIDPKNPRKNLLPSSIPTGHPPNFLASELQPECRLQATFFVLGWIADRLPHLVREIHSRGHEVACHGYRHELCNEQSHEDLKEDLVASKKLLEDAICAPVHGYRAPSFSISDETLKIIQDSGYLYDSSYNSSGLNKRYGKLGKGGEAGRLGSCEAREQTTEPRRQTPDEKGQRLEIRASDSKGHNVSFSTSALQPPNLLASSPPSGCRPFYELPISNLEIGGHVLPWGGGGYFRLIPFPLFKRGVESILKKDGIYVFYIHPWEIDPEQPKVREASRFFKFRHYVNLDKTFSKLEKIVHSFESCRFVTCSEYLVLKVGQAANSQADSSEPYEPSAMGYQP